MSGLSVKFMSSWLRLILESDRAHQCVNDVQSRRTDFELLQRTSRGGSRSLVIHSKNHHRFD